MKEAILDEAHRPINIILGELGRRYRNLQAKLELYIATCKKNDKNRRYLEDKLEQQGFKKSEGFDQALRKFVSLLENSFLINGEQSMLIDSSEIDVSGVIRRLLPVLDSENIDQHPLNVFGYLDKDQGEDIRIREFKALKYFVQDSLKGKLPEVILRYEEYKVAEHISRVVKMLILDGLYRIVDQITKEQNDKLSTLILPADSKAKEAFYKLRESISQYYQDYPKDKDFFELQASQFAFILSEVEWQLKEVGDFLVIPIDQQYL